MRIELYLNSEEYNTNRGAMPYMRHYRGAVTNEYDDGLRICRKFIELPDEIVNLRDMLENLAHKHNIDMIVYDRTRIRDTIRAFFKGVRKTPTIIIGKKKFVGIVTKDEIVAALKE